MRHPITTLVTQEARHILVLLQGAHFEVVHTQTGALLASTVAAGTKPSGCRRIAERHEGEETITAASLSGDGALLATTADDKLVKVWDTNAWTCQWTRRTGKRPTAVTFTNDAASVVLADKFGDVFHYPIGSVAPASLDDVRPVLGHLSLITDMTLSRDGRFVITADRDEKIRVTRFPKGYLIESYCLGHMQFVTRILSPECAPDRLISGGGDGALKLWDFVRGTALDSVDLRAVLETAEEADVLVIAGDRTGRIATALEGVPAIAVYQLDQGSSLRLHHVIKTALQPTALTFVGDGQLIAAWNDGDRLLGAYDVTGTEAVEVTDSPLVATVNAAASFEVAKLPDVFTYRQLRKFAKSTSRPTGDAGAEADSDAEA